MDASPSTTNTAGGNSSVSSEEPTASQTDASPVVGGSREESSRHCSAAGNASGKHCAEKEAYNAHGDPPKSQVNDAPISPTNDEVAIGVSELSGPVYEEINTNDAQPPESPEHCIPPSTPDDVAIELGGVDNLAYEPETSPTLPKEFTAIREVGEERDVPGCDEHDYDAPTSLTTPSSVSEDLAIDLSGLESPTHEAKSGDADSDKTVTPIPSEDYMSITIQEDVPTPKSPKSSNVSMTTVVTAVVESAQEKPVREGEELSAVSENDNTAPTYPPTATSESEHRVETMLLETVDLNTTLLASGDALPSLPPPHVLPDDDETSARILISDDMDKAALAELEMKILQKTESGSPPGAERCDSQLSTLSDKIDICRICHCEGEENNKLISPCLCSGSLKYLHLSCLQKWIKSSDKKSCELCNFDYIMSTKTRPFKEWEKLEMTHVERRKVVCSVTFHIIAITCVIWSLYVLIDRTTEEVHLGTLDWPFWTKLIVVAIGFTGGMIFMYVQCKMYVHLCVRWRAFNKLIFVENAPEDPQLRAEAAARIKDKAQEEGGMVNPIALQELDAV